MPPVLMFKINVWQKQLTENRDDDINWRSIKTGLQMLGPSKHITVPCFITEMQHNTSL